MLKQINDAVRSSELEHTYTIIETLYGSYKLQQSFTKDETELSFLTVNAAKLYAEQNDLIIRN